MTDSIPDPASILPLPESNGKLTIAVAWAKIDTAGNARIMTKNIILDCPGGGHQREAFLLQARMHQLVSCMGVELEEHGWVAREKSG